jgi:hypothetical protein
MNYIIGCGGVGSWLAPMLIKLVGNTQVTLVDGDVLETKNLDRQLFNEKQIGENKAMALSDLYRCFSVPDYFTMGSIDLCKNDWLLVCVDNDVARKCALTECDRNQCRAIIAANESTSAEAYLFKHEWKDSKIDPRVFYPAILTDTSGDPRARQAGCTGQAQVANPQLVTANAMAASLLSWLYVLWAVQFPKMDKSIEDKLPHKLVSNMSKLETFTIEKSLI